MKHANRNEKFRRRDGSWGNFPKMWSQKAYKIRRKEIRKRSVLEVQLSNVQSSRKKGEKINKKVKNISPN